MEIKNPFPPILNMILDDC